MLLAGAGLMVAGAGVLGAEVQVARSGTNLAERTYDYADAGATTAVWIGDSTAFGTGAADGADVVASRVAVARHERVVMLAVSGATVADVADRQLPKVAPARPDVVYLSVGSNDVTHLTSVHSFRTRYRRLLTGLPPGIPVVVLGVPDMGSPTRLAQPLRAIAAWRGRRLDREVRRLVAARAGATYVDIAGRTGPPFRRDPERLLAGDRYHPSSAGYGLWADAVLSA